MVHASHSSNNSLSLPQKIASAGLAGCTADLLTFPLDTVKVWLQVCGESSTSSKQISTNSRTLNAETTDIKKLTSDNRATEHLKITRLSTNAQRGNKKFESQSFYRQTNGSTKALVKAPLKLATNEVKGNNLTFTKHVYDTQLPQNLPPRNTNQAIPSNRATPGFLRTIVQGVRSNGFFSLYGGISAGLQRQVAFCAVRIGLYDTVKGFYHKLFPGSRNGKQVSQRILAGTTTAFIAVGLFQPAEVVKIRMQAQASKVTEPRIYTSSLQAYRSLFKVGFGEAWRGVGTNAARLAVVNVCELVTYDVIKELILDYDVMKDTPSCHFTSAFISGFITTVIASPIDVVKTRYMNARQGHYKGPLECAKHMLFKEGLQAFYKGFVPAYIRLGTWNIAMFVSYEQYKKFFHNHNQHQSVKSNQKMPL